MNPRHKQLGHCGDDEPDDSIDWPFWIVLALIVICAWWGLS